MVDTALFLRIGVLLIGVLLIDILLIDMLVVPGALMTLSSRYIDGHGHGHGHGHGMVEGDRTRGVFGTYSYLGNRHSSHR